MICIRNAAYQCFQVKNVEYRKKNVLSTIDGGTLFHINQTDGQQSHALLEECNIRLLEDLSQFAFVSGQMYDVQLFHCLMTLLQSYRAHTISEVCRLNPLLRLCCSIDIKYR